MDNSRFNKLVEGIMDAIHPFRPKNITIELHAEQYNEVSKYCNGIMNFRVDIEKYIDFSGEPIRISHPFMELIFILKQNEQIF